MMVIILELRLSERMIYYMFSKTIKRWWSTHVNTLISWCLLVSSFWLSVNWWCVCDAPPPRPPPPQYWPQTVTRGSMRSSPITPWVRTSAFHPTGRFSRRDVWTTRGPTICTSSWWWRWTAGTSRTPAPPRSVWGWPTSTTKPLNSPSLCEHFDLFIIIDWCIYLFCHM